MRQQGKTLAFNRELIAIFMDFRIEDGGNGIKIFKSMNSRYTIGMLNFNSEWNFLMPACKKWDNLDTKNFTKEQEEEYVQLCEKLDHFVTCYEPEPAFIQLVECIKWYNKLDPRRK